MREIIRKVPIPTAGVALGLAALGNLLQPYTEIVHIVCGILSLVLIAMLGAKIALFPDMIRDDLHNSIMASVSATLFMTLMQLADYLRRHPELHVAVRSGGTSELLALLNAGEIDCAFVEGFFDKNAYAWDVFRTERLVCVCAADHEFAARPVRVEDLFDERLIVREPGSGTRAVLEHALAAQNLTVDGFAQASVVESLDVIKILVEHDLGISFLYEAAVARELAAGTLRVIDLEGLAILHDIAFIRLKNSVFEREFQNLFADL